jgi:hypothetical protein
MEILINVKQEPRVVVAAAKIHGEAINEAVVIPIRYT